MTSNYEGEYRDGRQLRTGPLDWLLLAGYLAVGVVFFASVVWHWSYEVTNAASVFLIGAFPLWILRAFVGISWVKMTLGVIMLPIIALTVMLSTYNVGVMVSGLLAIGILLVVLFRRQIRRKLPGILYSLALRDEG